MRKIHIYTSLHIVVLREDDRGGRNIQLLVCLVKKWKNTCIGARTEINDLNNFLMLFIIV